MIFSPVLNPHARDLGALLKIAAEKPQYREEFFEQILTTPLYTYCSDEKLEDHKKKSKKIDLRHEVDEMGDPVFYFFTSETEMAKEFGTQPFVAMDGKELFEALSKIENAKAVLNPRAEVGRLFETWEIHALARGQNPQAESHKYRRETHQSNDPTDTRLKISVPATSPTQLTKLLVGLAAEYSEIRALYLTISERQKDLSYLVLVDADEDTFSRYCQGTTKLIQVSKLVLRYRVDFATLEGFENVTENLSEGMIFERHSSGSLM